MASLRKKDRSPFWFACYTLPDGRRTQRSTGTDDKRKAQRIANEFEDAARDASSGRFIESQARKVIADIYAMANTEVLPNSSLKEFFVRWRKRKSLEVADSTYASYMNVTDAFLEQAQAKANEDIKKITTSDLAKFRDATAERLTVSTANLHLKILRAAFADARREGLIDENPAERVTTLKKQDGYERNPFSLPQLKRLIEVADDEWRGMILFGLYTGQRLGDIAALTWQNVDVIHQEVRLTTGKTGRRQILPLAPPLIEYLTKLSAGDQPDSPIFPRANETITGQGRTGNLSNRFYRIMVAAGFAEKRSHQSKGVGRSSTRKINTLSFHSLRHTATTLLKSAGVSDAVAREFIGHDSATVSKNYTHIPTEMLRQASAKLPDVTKL